LHFKNGSSWGVDGQIGYFFGRKRHWGIGAGVMYMKQQGDIYLDKFRIEYASVDKNNDVFRQIVTANKQIKESITSNDLCLPLVLKYKGQFSSRWGFTMDAGLLFRLQMKNSYTTNASFNYEAIYKYSKVGNTTTAVYDNSAIPGPTDQLITQTFYNAHSANNVYSTAQEWFNAQNGLGQNVGLNVHTNSTSGTVSYKGTIGFIVQPCISYRLTDYLFFNMGLYYIVQFFNNTDNTKNYKLTDQLGSYSSVMNGVTSSDNSTYGVNLGFRIFIDKGLFTLGGRMMERRHMPYRPVYPSANERGQTDYERKYAELDRRNRRPVEPYNENIQYEEIPYKIIYFETAKYNLSKESVRKLNEIALYMKENPDVNLKINGHTDIVGTERSNQVLSENRAEAVKQYLEYKGIEPGRMSTKGFASRHPAATNRTIWGRAKNRRSELEIRLR
jgi:outer membrane protein OmpA-like peptidoglycan-associated protein